jgi:hypothetical protein
LWGLHLEIRPGWWQAGRWKYRFEGKEKLMALGKYPKISLAVARKRHGDGSALLEHWKDYKSARHVDSTRRRLASNILPSLGSLQIAEIEALNLVALQQSLRFCPILGSKRDPDACTEKHH